MADHSIHVQDTVEAQTPAPPEPAVAAALPRPVLIGPDLKAQLAALAQRLFQQVLVDRLRQLPPACSSDDTLRLVIGFEVSAKAEDLVREVG